MDKGGLFQRPPPVATKPSRSKAVTERNSLQRRNHENDEASQSDSKNSSGDPATYDEFIQSKGMTEGEQEVWMSSLDTWKLRRRNVTQSALERKASREEVEKNEQSRNRRRSKTYQEMMEEKEKREKILMKMASQHKSLEVEDVVHILTKPSLFAEVEDDDDDDEEEAKYVSEATDEVFASLPTDHGDAESDKSSKGTLLNDNKPKDREMHVPYRQDVTPVVWKPQKKRVSLGILGRIAAFNKDESEEKTHSVPSAPSQVSKLILAQDSEQEKEAVSWKDSLDDSGSSKAPHSNDQPQSQGQDSTAKFRSVKFLPTRHSVSSVTNRSCPEPFKTQEMDSASAKNVEPDTKQPAVKNSRDFTSNHSDRNEEPEFCYPGAPVWQQDDDSVPLSTRKTFRVEEEKRRLERWHAEQDRIRQEQFEQEQRRHREQQENGLQMVGKEDFKVKETQVQLEKREILEQPATHKKQTEMLECLPQVGSDWNVAEERDEKRQGQYDHHQQELKEDGEQEAMANNRNKAFSVGVEVTRKANQDTLETEDINKQKYSLLREEEIERIRAEEKKKLQKEWEELLREKARQEERERLEQERLEQLRAEQERLQQERIQMEQQQKHQMMHSTSSKTDADKLYRSSERISLKNSHVAEKSGSIVENDDQAQSTVIMNQEKMVVNDKPFSENNNKGSYSSGQSYLPRIQGKRVETRHWLVEEAERRRIAEKTNTAYPQDSKTAAIRGKDIEPVLEKRSYSQVASSAAAYRSDKSSTQVSTDVNRSQEKHLQQHPQLSSSIPQDLPPISQRAKTSKFEAVSRKMPPAHVVPGARLQPNQLSAPGRTSAFKQPSKSSTGARSVSGKVRCSDCAKSLNRGAAMIIESLDLYFHIDCFKCCVCNIQLGNGTKGTDVRIRASKLHCQNCYSSEAGFEFTQV